MTRARLVQWSGFQVPGPRDSAPVAAVLFVTLGLALATVCVALAIGALL